jgi:hypothetical protein
MKPTYQEIASDYTLWQEHADPHGVSTEQKFEAMSLDERIATLIEMFGPEEPKWAENDWPIN